ncbi:allantoinase AllB [Mitsuokella sp.]|uniref:allantoinase AllB n=1 Tax=Mitsuokella sp. TaxID=2049034 RepID=UPI003D7EC686
MFDLLVKNGQFVTPSGIVHKHMAVKDGRIAGFLDEKDKAEAQKIVDAKNNFVLPGVVDEHTHFDEPGYAEWEDFYHGSRAAAKGGVTTILDMPLNNVPPVTSAVRLQKKAAIASGKSYIDYGLWGALIRTNKKDLLGLAEVGAIAYKSFMCDAGPDYTDLNLEEIADRLSYLKTWHGLAGFHCEDYQMLKEAEEDCLKQGKTSRQDYLNVHSVASEKKAVADLIRIVQKTGTKAHICHVSHPEVAALVAEAKKNGIAVTAETCPQYLLLNEEDYLKRGGIFKCSPPLRSEEARKKLWQYVADGTIDAVASDYSPCTLERKDESGPKGAFGAWGGLSGVQTTLQGFWNLAVEEHGASPLLVAKVLAENPARIFGLWGRKGALLPGFDADFVFLDAERGWEIKAKQLEYLNKFSAFVGLQGTGLPVATYLRGRCIYEDGVFPEKPQGRFVPAKLPEPVE